MPKGPTIMAESMHRTAFCFLSAIVCSLASSALHAQTLDAELQRISAQELVAAARKSGDAARGAIVFFQPHMACAKCHAVGSDANPLGPDLTQPLSDATDEALVESVLLPSKVIRKGYESVSVLTVEGQVISAILVEQTPEKVTLRDVARDGAMVTIAAEEIEQIKQSELSIMPAGQMNQLNSKQQFFDLIRYLIEIRDGGPERAKQLQPSAALLTFTVPDYESHLDHAGLIGNWNADSFIRGEAIYNRVCANCHGTREQAGSLPTSLRFADGQFKNGSDPLSMYRTMTHGFGQMTPQAWMVPSQKYDVIHYIRKAYLEPHNPSALTQVDAAYLASLPKGDTFGPEPSTIEAWSAMDYGPSLIHTYEIPGSKHNFAYKGVAVRLDSGAGGVSRGRHWMVFDTDTLRVAAGWNSDVARSFTLRNKPADAATVAHSSTLQTGQSGEAADSEAIATSRKADPKENFIDWRAIQFNGEHGIHPKILGELAFANSTGPGWADPATGSFVDDQRVLGRDGKQYGPLPREWGRFKGLYHYDQQTIFSYSIGNIDILESPRLQVREGTSPLLLRTFNIGPRDRDLILQIAEHPDSDVTFVELTKDEPSAVRVAQPELADDGSSNRPLQFDGETYLEIADAESLDMMTQDFSILARIKTETDGSIFSLNDGGASWVANGQTFFIRDGRLGFDIGWVGEVSGQSKVNDGQWHNVGLTWEHSTQRVRLYLDGKLDGEGKLAAKEELAREIVRIGFTSPNFPQPESFFQGEISQVRFYQSCLAGGELEEQGNGEFSWTTDDDSKLMGDWKLENQLGLRVGNSLHNGPDGEVRRGAAPIRPNSGPIIAGFAPRELKAKWVLEDGNLRLKIPAGEETLRFSVWLPSSSSGAEFEPTSEGKSLVSALPAITDAAIDLIPLTKGGPPRWPQTLTTPVVVGADTGPFAVDILTAPESNPWLALTRFTGHDFYPDGRIAICTWDGDVWLVTPTQAANSQSLQWQRIASGMFQPLGLKIVADKIHLICRDQLVVLHDLNADGEIDFYQCLNNDHQVTEHFHEFAMGLQTDADGNFYYAKSGCHGKTAVVPHHGTLLRVSADGSRTDILANGFRAANGVCLNPDGSFFVTDQEGYWNPKNRINWVTVSDLKKPNFYGNMLGYHNVTDESDAAMVPPLCWITNEFDRSPAELLWVESDRWGPLQGALLNLSYGYGKVFLVPHEKVNGAMQGGMIELPIPSFPTGVMRGRFHPINGQLYLCGMFAWAGNATHPGGFYRVRYTGQPIGLATELRAFEWGLELEFSEAVDATSVADIKNFSIEVWDLKRTKNYGSEHFNQRPWSVKSAQLSSDGKTVRLTIPEIAPTWGMQILYQLKTADRKPLHGKIHNTIHQLRTALDENDPQ
jgi:putative heme-binding domain-containing protein